MARERSNTDCAMLLENAERIYLMCRARKVQRETQAWVSVLEEAMMGMPAWLAGRVRAGRDKLPLALAQVRGNGMGREDSRICLSAFGLPYSPPQGDALPCLSLPSPCSY